MCKNFEPFSIPVAATIRRSKMQVQIIELTEAEKLHFTTATHIIRNNQLITVSTGVAQVIISWNVPQSWKLKTKLSSKKVPLITNATPANVKRKKLWTKLQEEPNIQHQLWQFPMTYTRFRMIMQFSLQCRKKTTCCEQSLESLNMFKKLSDYCAPSAPDTKK